MFWLGYCASKLIKNVKIAINLSTKYILAAGRMETSTENTIQLVTEQKQIGENARFVLYKTLWKALLNK